MSWWGERLLGVRNERSITYFVHRAIRIHAKSGRFGRLWCNFQPRVGPRHYLLTSTPYAKFRVSWITGHTGRLPSQHTGAVPCCSPSDHSQAQSGHLFRCHHRLIIPRCHEGVGSASPFFVVLDDRLYVARLFRQSKDFSSKCVDSLAERVIQFKRLPTISGDAG